MSENIDSGNSKGELLSTILLAFASYERSVIVDRVRGGIQAARERGVQLGRPRHQKRLNRVRKLSDDGFTALEIAQRLGCSRQNIYACLNRC